MKKTKKIQFFTGLFFSFLISGSLKTYADDYAFDEISNTYTIEQQSGDITTVFNEILSTASGSSELPATIVIKDGNYEMGLANIKSSNIYIDANDAYIKFTGSSHSGQYMIKCTTDDLKNITISGGTWDGNNISTDSFHFGSSNVSCSNVTIKDCSVLNSKNCSVRIENVDTVNLSSLDVSSSNYGLLVLNCNDVTATSCKGTTNSIGLGFRSLTGLNTFNNLSVSKNKADGLQIQGSGTVININGGKFNNNGKNGISMTTGAQVTLKKADVSNNKSNGISPVGNSTTNTSLKAYNTTFNNNGRHGLAADYYIDIYLSKCSADNNKTNGFFMNHSCTSSNISNCTANNNGGCGILIQGKSKCKKITSVTTNSNKSMGISLENVSATIDKCTSNKNKGSGIYLKGTNASTVTIKNCKTNSNKSNGIYIMEKKTVNVSNCESSSNTQNGIFTKGTKLTVKGSKTILKGNKNCGVLCQKGKANISDAKVTSNKKHGIQFIGTGSSGSCTKLDISSNKCGIALNNGALANKISDNKITKNTEYGIAVYSNKSGRKTTIKQYTNNKLNNPKAKANIRIYPDTSVPSNVEKLAKK